MSMSNSIRSACMAYCMLLVTASAASAEPLTIQGVNPEMDYEQVVSTLRARGAHCNEPIEREIISLPDRPTYMYIYCWSSNAVSGDESDILVRLTELGKLMSINFECEATRTCGLRVDEVVQALIQADVLPDSVQANILDNAFYYDDIGGNSLWVSSSLRRPDITLRVNEESYRSFDF